MAAGKMNPHRAIVISQTFFSHLLNCFCQHAKSAAEEVTQSSHLMKKIAR
jgi:hypothetical protein